ncbi:MAG: hypothetical protein IJ766_04755 [Clostridia bacterium]|nr:hypothetical protein [Clostridia bacterium]
MLTVEYESFLDKGNTLIDSFVVPFVRFFKKLANAIATLLKKDIPFPGDDELAETDA